MTNLSDHYIRQQAELLAKTIDFEVMTSILMETGWTKLVIDYGNDQRWDVVKQWAEDNLLDKHQEHAGTWIFENKKDATAFALRWRTKV